MENIVNGFNFSNLPLTAVFVGEIKDNEWPHYLWDVTFNGKNEFFTVPYKCGLAHATKTTFGTRAKRPQNSDIMYSLLIDIEAADMSFNAWCDEYGFSNDSMKAFKAYQTCCEYAVFMRKMFSAQQIEEMRKALEDY